MWLVEGRGLPPARQARPSQSRTLGRANGSLVISRGRAGSSTPALRLLGYRLVLTQLRDQRGTSGGASTSRQLKESVPLLEHEPHRVRWAPIRIRP
jgi:hypothetical protein